MRGLLWKCADFPRSPTMLSHNLKISLEIKGFSGIKSQRAVTAFPWTLFNETECLNLSTYHVLCNARSSQLQDVVFLFSFDNQEKWNTGYIVWLTQIRTGAAYPDRSPSHASKVTLITVQHCLLEKAVSVVLYFVLVTFSPASIFLAWEKHQGLGLTAKDSNISFNDKTGHMKLTETVLTLSLINNHFRNLTEETKVSVEHCFSNTRKYLGNDFSTD